MRRHLWSTVAVLVMVFFAFGSVSGNKSSTQNVPDGGTRKDADVGGSAADDERRKKKEEGARKAEEEYDSDGIVLLRKSVSGTQNQIGLEVTGTVVNRRTRALSYAQITFNVYDDSGAQVGSALANINGLEPGGRWNFKAVSFTKGTTYKFSKLTGF